MKRITCSLLLKRVSIVVFIATITGPVISQNIGIGTVNPAEKLQVAGNIKADTIKPNAIKLTPNAGDGKILTSDAAGNASWQTTTASAGNIGYGVWGDCGTNGNISEYQPVADSLGTVINFFGFSVALSGNYAIVGAHLSSVGVNAGQGKALVYYHDGSSWVLMQTLTDPAGEPGDHFGVSVSISGNYAIVGSYHDDIAAGTDRGSALIYQFNGTSWVFMQKILDSGGSANDNFGCSVAISGDAAIVGANMDDFGANSDQGSVSFFHFNGSSWVLTQKSAAPAGAAGDRFGGSVAISGDKAIIGAMLDDITTTDQGSASIYHNNGVTGWDFIQNLTDQTGVSGNNFGNAVSISGNFAIVGAVGENINANADQGSARIFQYQGSSWTLIQKITDPSGDANDRFGHSVAISGNYAIVGANFDDDDHFDQGSASIYQRIGSGWQRMQLVTDPGGISNDFFGGASGIDATTKRFIVGATGFNNGTGKAVFGKIN